MSHPSTARLSLTNQCPNPGGARGGAGRRSHMHCGFIGLHCSIAERAGDWKQHHGPSAEAGTAADGSWTQLWAPNQGGCWSNPSEQEPGQEPFTNPFPLMLLQIKVPLGRNNCSAKDKLRFFLGCQTILQFSQLSFQALRPVPWQRGRPAPRFYCHKVIVPFWSFFLVVFFFCHSNYNYQGFNRTNKRIFNSTLGILIALPKCDNVDGAAVATTAHTAAVSLRTASCGSFGRIYPKYWLCQARMGLFLHLYVLIMNNAWSCSFQQDFRGFSFITQFHWPAWREDT